MVEAFVLSHTAYASPPKNRQFQRAEGATAITPFV